ncbi:MAG: WYL domain-containing protein [Victivallales bacterium]|jgi:helix-turn-helix type 11 domain protein
MSVQARQALRLMKFVAEMKKNNYPNAGSFARLLREMDINENMDCACSSRTVLRDIEVLQKEYHAPIAYDAVRRGYYLKNRDWEFQCPIMGDELLSMTLLGTRLASDLLPEPIRSDVNTAVEKALTGNSSEFFDEAMIESLLCATGIKAAVEPMIFKDIFEGWRCHQVLALTYRKPNGGEQERKFEPHIIAFHHGIWYIKGYEYGTKNIKTYAIQRITSVAFGIDTFETDKKLLDATRRNGLFEYPKIDGIRLHCDASIAFYLYEHQKVKKFKIERQDDGSLIVTLRPAFEHEVIRWILGEAGHIEVLYPPELRRKVAEAGRKISERNS